MTTATDSGVVDMSGVITSILRSYQAVVTQYQQMVTGDPGALNTAGQTLQDKATTLASVSSDLTQRANTLASTWEGDAATAFHNAATGLGGQLDTDRATAAQEGQRLIAAAGLLQGAKTQMDSIVSQFQQYSQTLIAESRNAAAGAAGQFVQAAQQLGESAVNAAKSLVDQVGQALLALWQPATAAAEAASEGAAEAAERDKEFTGKPGQRMLANQPWFQQWYRQTYGKDPDPNHLKMGALSWLSKDDVLDGRRRSTSAPGGFVNTGWWSVGANGVQPAGAPLKANTPFGSLDDPPATAPTAAKVFHDTNISLYDTGKHTLGPDLTLYDPKASGDVNMGAYGDLNGKAEFSIGPQLTGQGNVSIHNGQLQAGGDLKGTLLDANASGAYTNGPLAVQGSGDAMVGGDLSGHLSAGMNGVAAHGNVFAGAQMQGTVSADVAGIGVGATGGLQAGIGAQFDAQATWQNGHFLFNAKAGATLGVGATVGGNIDVDVPKLVNTAEQYGTQAYNTVSDIGTAVENTAGQAANAVGAVFNSAGRYVGAW